MQEIIFIKEEELNLSIPNPIRINLNNMQFLYFLNRLNIQDEEIEMHLYNEIYHSIENN